MAVRETKNFGSISRNIMKLLHKNKIHHYNIYWQYHLCQDHHYNIYWQHHLSLNHIWKKRNKEQFDDTIIPATNVIINIKNELRNIILTHYKHHTINNTLDEFQSNFCINNSLCKLTHDIIKTAKYENMLNCFFFDCS